MASATSRPSLKKKITIRKELAPRWYTTGMRTIVQLSEAQLAQLLECAPRRERLAEAYHHQQQAKTTEAQPHLALSKVSTER